MLLPLYKQRVRVTISKSLVENTDSNYTYYMYKIPHNLLEVAEESVVIPLFSSSL